MSKEEIKKVPVDEDGFFLQDNVWKPTASMEWSEKHFPGRADGIEPDAVYSIESSFHFRAGSYSLYNQWRDILDENISDGNSFRELINFADNEGVIGPIVSKKLYKDFEDNYEKALKVSEQLDDDFGSYWIEKYKLWTEAFKSASDNGAVIFC